jgi:UDP-N-acetylbacillosamine transaminase
MSGNELKLIEDVFQSNYIAPLGKYVNLFEEKIANHINIPKENVLALNTGTSAIHLALKVLGIKKDDFVLASSFTFIGSVAPILYQNATPIFIDSDNSWNLSPKLLDDFLSQTVSKNLKLPKALIVTHLYGQMAKIDEIKKITDKYQIYLIEDSAESLGATFKNQQSGTFGDFGIFSFNGNKILTTSGAGVLVSNNPKYGAKWIEKAKFYSTQAKENTIHYEHLEYGFNYRLSNVLASIGVAQMEVLTERVRKKREIFERYKSNFANFKCVKFMPEIKNSEGNRWLTTLIIDTVNYKKILKDTVEDLNQNNIETRPLWKPMHLQPLFNSDEVKSIKNIDNTSENLFKKGICLPSGTELTIENIDLISQIIIKNIKKYI